MRIVVAYGTRPEVIKLKPVVDALRARGVTVTEWCSGQSKDFVSSGNINWSTLHSGIAHTLTAFGEHCDLPISGRPECVIVQGDTATAFACAQAAFLSRVPVAHVEAGLRTYREEPWPEEVFRRQIGAIARWHFCPDIDAACNLHRETDWRNEGFDRVYVTGNTVIDTLPRAPLRVFVTLHRRENWGTRIQRALDTLYVFASNETHITFIRHPNWRAQGLFEPQAYNIKYLAPLDRDELLTRLQESDLVVTDSGGLQEEAAHFGIPTLVLRTATERTALAKSGAIELVDPDDPRALSRALERILARRRAYGDGASGERIATILVKELTRVDTTTSKERENDP